LPKIFKRAFFLPRAIRKQPTGDADETVVNKQINRMLLFCEKYKETLTEKLKSRCERLMTIVDGTDAAMK
jgi:hypothetical protein